jgi:predicted ArsR family transcriptional regulator
MTQRSLFDDPLPAHCRSRRTDPVSSKLAAEEMTQSGAIGRQQLEVLEALRKHGPCTSAELAFRSGLDRHLCGRRLPDLAKQRLVIQGAVRACSVGRPACEWRVT